VLCMWTSDMIRVRSMTHNRTSEERGRHLLEEGAEGQERARPEIQHVAHQGDGHGIEAVYVYVYRYVSWVGGVVWVWWGDEGNNKQMP
jgi:hypothetical protein